MKSRDESLEPSVSPFFEEARKVILAAGRSCVPDNPIGGAAGPIIEAELSDQNTRS